MVVIPQTLRYSLRFAGQAAGEQRLTLEPLRSGSRLILEATVELPSARFGEPHTRQRWESELDPTGYPRRYRERVEGREARVMEVQFLRDEGLVVVSQGKEDLAIPYVSELHDPLSLILAVARLEIAPGEVRRYGMVGGRVYVERLADQTLELPWGQTSARVFRLRPGLSLLYYDADGYPVRMTQKVGDHVFEAQLLQVQRERPSQPENQEEPRRRQRRRRRR
ncbi:MULTISPECIES: DUF3108 domain-containing protein [unclassified Meiothermus]|uniref:DUF3108 domain-containing protein n=1 Tax=unclassified Meiothermus TaxID=370471 RepID=UPI000D7BD2E1|nr:MULTISPECIES: DUF3108 domain-containing protein [unclassified Meiothermus]PZA07834.1 DUF3108 domain-containing protein [Meiothermus sp. Pnk-1]RYM38862.1 DUF3108 domain-containing protein [Meiothermus sp. PNK-Is4]